MEVNLRPETESRIQELAAKTGRALDDLFEDAMAGYLQELAQRSKLFAARVTNDAVHEPIRPPSGGVL